MNFPKLLLEFANENFSSRPLNGLQESTWRKLAKKTVETPKDLTPIEAFQIGRMIERVRSVSDDETKKELDELSTKIKVSL